VRDFHRNSGIAEYGQKDTRAESNLLLFWILVNELVCLMERRGPQGGRVKDDSWRDEAGPSISWPPNLKRKRATGVLEEANTSDTFITDKPLTLKSTLLWLEQKSVLENLKCQAKLGNMPLDPMSQCSAIPMLPPHWILLIQGMRPGLHISQRGRELSLVRSRRDHRVWYLRHLMENRCRMRMRMRMTTLVPHETLSNLISCTI